MVADGYRGLLRVNPGSGRVEVLTDGADGVPFRFTDDVDVASDGTIYFTDASSKFGPAMHARDDIIEHGGHGRFLKFDPASGATTVLIDGLQFANGVALSGTRISWWSPRPAATTCCVTGWRARRPA